MSDRSGREGQKLDNYSLIRLLGAGTFGEVYLAEHSYRPEFVAIKVLPKLADSDLAGFLNEARTIRLRHPHIMQILDFGVDNHVPFIVMDYAPNGTLRQRHPKGARVPLDTIVSYVKQIAGALQYAHDERMIHRDVKPENILLGPNNEILVSDFGIATMAHSSRSQSVQEMAGTITYMAPEQIQGKPRFASDQYALGIIVYEWLCGNRPFQGSFTEIATQHLLASPPSLRDQLPTISPLLEQVVVTALEKEPHKRFASVQAFAQALEQASQEGKRRPAPFVVGAQPASADVSLANPYNLPTMMVASSTEGVSRMGMLRCSYRGHTTSVNAVIWSPDGMSIASADDMGTVQVWKANTGSHILTYRGHSDAVSSIVWSSDGKYIASASEDRTVHVWEVTTGYRALTYRGHSGGVWSIAWAPGGDCIASASEDQTVQVWGARTGDHVFTLDGSFDSVWAMAWSPDDRYIAFQSASKLIQVCDAVDGHKVRTYRKHTDGVWSISWSPDGKFIASGGDDRTIQIWAVASGREVLRYSHADSILAVAWSPDGARIASGGEDYTVQIWAPVPGKPAFIYGAHSAPVQTIAWSPDGAWVASGGEDCVVHVWAAREGQQAE